MSAPGLAELAAAFSHELAEVLTAVSEANTTVEPGSESPTSGVTVTIVVQNAVPVRSLGVATSNLTFFRQIGGSSNGAVIRDALDERLSKGYPVAGHPELAGQHRIAAYYSVPVTQADLCAAILAFGPLVIGTPWARSWFHPADGVLPAFDADTVTTKVSTSEPP